VLIIFQQLRAKRAMWRKVIDSAKFVIFFLLKRQENSLIF
jgi:hypothetical protein